MSGDVAPSAAPSHVRAARGAPARRLLEIASCAAASAAVQSMHEMARALPEPGESPFHVKGNIYHGTHLFFASEVKGGIEALYAQLHDEKLRAFIQQPFLAVGWYDALPAAQLIRAEAQAMRLSVAHYLRYRSAFQAERDIGGVYKLLLKLATPEAVAMKLPRLSTQMFDFGSAKARVVEKGHVEGSIAGLPQVLVEWVSTAFVIYAETALRLAGGVHVLVKARAPQPSGEQNGIELATVGWDLRYR